jgi:hypothetical protein
MRKSLCLVPLAMLALSACDNNNSGGSGSSSSSSSGGGSSSSSSSSGGSSSGGTGSEELSSFVLNLFNTETAATALPTDLTTVTLIDTPTVEATAYDGLFAASSSSSGG